MQKIKIIILLLIFVISYADAKRSKSRSSGYSSSSKGSSSYRSSSRSSNKYLNRSSSRTSNSKSSKSSFEQARERKIQKTRAKQSYNAYKEKRKDLFKTDKVVSNSKVKDTTSNTSRQPNRDNYGYDNYYQRKNSYYDNNFIPKPYMRNSPLNFGIWDAAFLWMMFQI